MKDVLCALVVLSFFLAGCPIPAESQSVLTADVHHEDGIQGLGAAGVGKTQSPFARASFLVVAVLAEGIIFLLPGLALSSLLDSYRRLEEMTFVCAAFVGSGAAGYVVLWVYLADTRAGRTLSVAVLPVGIGIIALAVWRSRVKTRQLRHIATTGMLMALVTVFYISLGFLYQRSTDPLQQAQLRFVHPLPSDNTIPFIFADKLYHSQPLRPFLLGDWKSSDRPPLQAALALMQFPLWRARDRELDYQILGTFLQCMWLPAVWTLLRSLAVDRRTVAIVFAFCIFSGFFLVHTFYVWPKLLAAAYFIFAVTMLRFAERKVRKSTPVHAAVAGSAMALALLSHGGVAFSIAALGILLLVSRDFPPVRAVLAGALMASLFLLPWTIYQKVYDPPGDRLLKWHLAGVTELDSRPLGALFTQAYTRPRFSVILRSKIQNVETLFGHLPCETLRSSLTRQKPIWRTLLQWYKEETFFYLFQTLGVMNLGFLTFALARAFRPPALLAAIQPLFLLAIVSLVIWCLLMYIPGSTLVHQGSLADVVILFVALAICLVSTSPQLAFVVLGFQVLLLFPLFALSDVTMSDAFTDSRVKTAPGLSSDPGMAFLSVICLLAFATLGWRAGFVGARESVISPAWRGSPDALTSASKLKD